jgi:hypothetical protein
VTTELVEVLLNFFTPGALPILSALISTAYQLFILSPPELSDELRLRKIETGSKHNVPLGELDLSQTSGGVLRNRRLLTAFYAEILILRGILLVSSALLLISLIFWSVGIDVWWVIGAAILCTGASMRINKRIERASALPL